MELRQLKTFRTVVEYLSFTRAAEQLCLAQSSVSAQIRGLEEELGTTLFDRIGRRVFLTEAGRKLYEYAGRIEGMTEEIRSEIAGDKYQSGQLTIRIPETLATVYMPKVIRQFRREYPQVKLKCINCSDLQLSRELNSGRIDLAFLMTDSIHLSDVSVTFLKTEELVMAASPDHELAGKHEVRPADLQEQTILLPLTD